MGSHKDMNLNKFRIPTTEHFLKEEGVKPSKGQTLQFIDGECREMGRENKEVRQCQLAIGLTFMRWQSRLPNL